MFSHQSQGPGESGGQHAGLTARGLVGLKSGLGDGATDSAWDVFKAEGVMAIFINFHGIRMVVFQHGLIMFNMFRYIF